ncbi:type VI secretion system-associated protein [Serratia sp. 2723]|uniref:type VI secretion system-associated protein n=1 Tax=unclassified Serratia (in: enterobacteria) TaxID=2647522 RepID=UPI003D21EBD6
MKYWISGIIVLMVIPAVHAENYRLVHSPTLKLEVFIDDVTSSKPESWCANSIPLRITSAQSKDADILHDFLPRVGKLLAKQCPKVAQLPWILTDKQGTKIASGNATKNQHWEPVAQPRQATNSFATTLPPAVAVTSPLAAKETATSFALPQGCRFRTYWNNNVSDSTLFVPSTDALSCDNNGFLHGHGPIIIQNGGVNQTHDVVFYQGYPLLNIDTGNHPLTLVSANAQRLILGASDSFLVLPYNPQLHAWIFQGEVLIEMARNQATTQAAISQRVTRVHNTWRPLFTKQAMPLTFRLVETLAVERVDPASGSYLSVNGITY